MIYSVKWKESHMYTYKKHPRTWPVSMIDNEELFLLLLYFFHLFLSFSFLYFFSGFYSLNLFSCYILLFLHHFLHPHVSQVLGVFSLCSPSPLLESSTLNCKAACLLFRHHLHINAARELVRRHLMQMWQLFEDICCPSPFLLLV